MAQKWLSTLDKLLFYKIGIITMTLPLRSEMKECLVCETSEGTHLWRFYTLLCCLINITIHCIKCQSSILNFNPPISAVLSALGNLISQALESKKKLKEGQAGKEVDVRGPVRFAIYGLVITGPLSHYFYQLLELLFPASAPFSMLKRLLLERLVFAPAFLLLFFVVMNALEGKTSADLQDKLKAKYWPALKMNWKVWTPFQFININYVPVQFRVLFANLIALFWNAYLTSIRK